MTTPDKILADLLTSPATADAIGQHVRIPELVAKALCQRHETDGLVSESKLDCGLVVYALTDNGRDVARSLPTLTPAAR